VYACDDLAIGSRVHAGCGDVGRFEIDVHTAVHAGLVEAAPCVADRRGIDRHADSEVHAARDQRAFGVSAVYCDR
jgi:hypothetical protein